MFGNIVIFKKRIDNFCALLRVFDSLHAYKSNGTLPLNFKCKKDLEHSAGLIYVLILSYLYSLFDKRGFCVTKFLECPIKDNAKKYLKDMLKMWVALEKPITRIRHNLGFHGGMVPQYEDAFEAFLQIEKKGLLPKILNIFSKIEKFSNEYGIADILDINKIRSRNGCVTRFETFCSIGDAK